MPKDPVDVVGVGNAIVDVIAQVSDDFVADEGLEKGSMTLIDDDRADKLYKRMGTGQEASGGSAANTMAGLASFGGSAAYIGKVANDGLGDLFGADMRAIGVEFDQVAATEGPATGRSLILVTPDAQRTMNTFLGISSLLEPADISPDVVERGEIVFCEGYLWDMPSAKKAIRLAMDIARAAGKKVAFTASDTFCVERHHTEFLGLVAEPIDILFANRAELLTMYGDDFDAAVAEVRGHVELACITLSGDGSLLVTADEVIEVAPEPVAHVVDTTGAGDQYAAGLLYGITNGLDLAEAGRLGSLAASEVISHVGPRPLVPLKSLLP